ncbi:Bug family tripartite tricarboxylate transporter substrate binding protein [Amorphus coralli]|uniref:Bug family tripartite tricarboxylate transporter substrate binding protein n=1 Tax=Amorphus coralli TaxID=340680 RepID=UPI00036C81B2|nr:tripartite tricarboxylate transporter substrate-binding protein [Amorphus coralli]
MQSRARTVLAGIAASAVIAGATVTGAFAQSPYEGEDVTLIIPNSPAGLMSQYAHTLAPHIAENLGARNVRVVNHQGGGGLKGSNILWESDPDGMTFAMTNVPTLLVAQLAESPGVQFNATDFTYLGRVQADPRLMFTGKPSGLKTIEDVRNLDRPFVFASQGTDEDFYTMVVLADALGYDLKIVTGYEGDADTSLAVIRGDADGHMTTWTQSAPAVEAGDKYAVLATTFERYEGAPDVPTALEIIEDPKQKENMQAISSILVLGRGFFGPPDMDPEATEALRAAIEKTLTDPEVLKEMKEKGLPVSFNSADAQKENVDRVFANGKNLTPMFKEAVTKIQ